MISEINLLELFVESLLAERGLAKNTILAYMTDLKDLFQYYNGNNISILSLDHNNLIEYAGLLGKQRLSATTLARKISALRQLYHFLVSERLVKLNPALNLEHPKKAHHFPKSLTKEEIDNLLKAAYSDSSPEGLRNIAIVELLYSTGMRISELISLKLKWLLNPVENAQNYKVFSIVGKGGKERLIIINMQAAAALNNYLEIRHWFIKDGIESPFLFPSYKKKGTQTHLSRQMCFYIIKNLAIIAQIDPDKVSPHKIRHSFASHMLWQGANLRVVQDLMGHSDITSTQVYTQVLSEQAKQLVLDKHPLAASKIV